MSRTIRRVLVYSGIFLLFSQFVFAQGFLGTQFDPLGNLDLRSIYERYGAFIDVVIVFALFLATLRRAEGLTNRVGKSGASIIAVALTLSLFVGEYTTGLRIADLGPYVALVVAMWGGFSFYKVTQPLFGANAFWTPFGLALFMFGLFLRLLLGIII